MTTQFDPRRAQPTWSATTHDAFGNRTDLHADDNGIVRPRTQSEADAADTFGLPVARKVLAEERPRRTSRRARHNTKATPTLAGPPPVPSTTTNKAAPAAGEEG